MVGDGLQEIQNAGALYRKHVPQPIVAAAPDDPVVAASDRRRNRLNGSDIRDIGRQCGSDLGRIFGRSIVHVTEIVLVGRGKGPGVAANAHCFVEDMSGAMPAHRT